MYLKNTLEHLAQFSLATKYYGLVFSCLLLLCFSTALNAEESLPLSLQEAETLALESEPGRDSLIASADALQELSVAAGQLSDPKLRAGLANFPIESGGFSTEGMTQVQLGVRQAFPSGNSREVSTRKFQALALEQLENASTRERNVISAVRELWLDNYYWTNTQKLVEETRPFFKDLLTVTTDLYALGMKDQQDVLRAEIELSRLDDRLININKQVSQAQAKLSKWIGTNAFRPLEPTLPNWSELPSRDSLQQNLRSHPTLNAANARIKAQDANIDLAKASYKPAWAVDLGYAYRDGLLPSGQSRSDFISLGVSVDLPVFKRNRQDKKLSAAVSQRRSASDSHKELVRLLSSQVDTEYARWESLNRRIDLYKDLLLVQTNQQTELAMQAYQNNTGDFAEVMRAYIANLNTQIDFERLQIERAQSYAQLANLGGLTP